MMLKLPLWIEYMKCPLCTHNFDISLRQPVTLACSHTICKSCISSISRKLCPYDQVDFSENVDNLPPNYALLKLITDVSMINRELPPSIIEKFTPEDLKLYELSMKRIEEIGMLASPTGQILETLSRPIHRKLIGLIQCQLLENQGRARMMRAARALADRIVVEFILLHQDDSQLNSNLFTAIRARGCQFLGPKAQEEALKLVVLAFENNKMLSRKGLAAFIVPRLKFFYAAASKTNIGHVIQLLYRAGCFDVQKCDNDSSLMTLKEEYRTYDELRLEHDSQIVQIANEAGLRIGPDKWSILLYGNLNHRSHMQSVMDRRKNVISFAQSIDDLTLTLQKTGDPFKLKNLSNQLDSLSNLSPSFDLNTNVSFAECSEVIKNLQEIVFTFTGFITNWRNKAPKVFNPPSVKYKVSLCKQLQEHGRCGRWTTCRFAHSVDEMKRYRDKDKKSNKSAVGQASKSPGTQKTNSTRPSLNIPAPNYAPPQLFTPLMFGFNQNVHLISSPTYNQSTPAFPSSSASRMNHNFNIQQQSLPPISPGIQFRFVRSNSFIAATNSAYNNNMSMAGMYQAIGEVSNLINTINQRQVNQMNGRQQNFGSAEGYMRGSAQY